MVQKYWVNAMHKFMEWYFQTPEKARHYLVYYPFTQPISLSVMKNEIEHLTKKGKEYLVMLGFKEGE